MREENEGGEGKGEVTRNIFILSSSRDPLAV